MVFDAIQTDNVSGVVAPGDLLAFNSSNELLRILTRNEAEEVQAA